ncbi:beta-phosphoglucomutase [Clostridium sp. MCC353]|uniref:beta-phosphoglucomutase n=1 Tax=Clostridium sp. MCC353 TaxID=2592646 RepID=UPI001C02CE11|nr:beta-phosphoglucomutase [Clostridium sp. MCC353]MBT9777332.1 beta-phosphoglucomutase [Clostridium sp. MCC353]
MSTYKGLLFDLDGVIVDTAKYHFMAWKSLADELGILFTQEDNERLKGVSRMASFEIILEIGKKTMSQEEKEACCAKKNEIYVDYIKKLREDEILPGVREFLTDARDKGYKTALGSASKNSPMILEGLGIRELFDAVIDGTKTSRAKPDPEVFLKGAQALGLSGSECIVFEDAAAGILAAHNGGMKAVGIGSPQVLCEADLVMAGFEGVKVEDVIAKLETRA